MQNAIESKSLPEWCKLMTAAIDSVKRLEQEVNYQAACQFACDFITCVKSSTPNFAERSFVLALRPHINPYDLGYNW